ncbi:quinon protein alcohol dehydrogenase-like superfamily [Flagelloscypha sp. PMI_526]|nr:quinon protein alcohol dehydrogenase-like superfamily [Flagelloscypha sp. PMI_526]
MSSVSPVPNLPSVGEHASIALPDAFQFTKEFGEMLENVPYVKGVAGILVHILKIREEVIGNDERCIEILERIKKEKDNLIGTTKKLAMFDHSIAEGDLKDYEQILKEIEKVLDSYRNRKGWRMKISKTLGRKEMASILEKYERRLNSFHARVQSNRLVDTFKLTFEARIPPLLQHITSIVRFQSNSQRLCPCLSNTRLDILGEIDRWIMKETTQPSIFLLYGHPGTGKSTISKSLEEKLAQRKSGALGAVFFCRRQEGANHSARAFWCQIAAGMMTKHHSIALALASEFQNQFPDVESIPIDVLFDTLIANPIRKGYKGTQPLVFVVDALDEFGGRNPDRRLREELIKSLHYWSRLPSRCHLFITSRQETDIQGLLNSRSSNVSTLEVGEHATNQSSQDIRLFFEDQFNQMYKEENPPSRLKPDELTSLVKHAAGLFIWARTVTEMIRIDRTFLERAIREQDSLVDLGALYTDMLLAAFPETEAKNLELFKKISGVMITAQVPLSLSALSHLCQVKESTVIDVFYRRLKPVLVTKPTLSFLHKSFEDFLASSACPEKYRCKQKESHHLMSQWCLAVLNSEELHFNMGELTNSHQMNSEAPNLKEKVPEWVRYSCQWFGAHLESSGLLLGDVVLPDIRSFLCNKFFYWLEVMSIGGSPRLTIGVLGSAARSIQNDPIRKLLQDCTSFVQTFAQPIFQSYAQIYLSGLSLSPQLSLIAEQGTKLMKNRIRIAKGGLKHWPTSLNTMHGHSSTILSLAFSPDSQSIISGSIDNTLRLWDVTTGASIGEPLQDHSNWVNSVAFSPDGRRIVSGSGDMTIRLWDTTTGAVIGQPLSGHSNAVNCVAFSPDGQRIVSGSTDKTLRLWDATTGTIIGEPLRGHFKRVNSVAFSPNGHCIVSGSDDRTLCLWNVTTRTIIGEPLRGHSDSVKSVAFFPDGHRLVSGSSDKTVCLWDATTGAIIGEPLRGHFGAVVSVAISPDGRCIISGSHDKTVRLWDATTGAIIGEPLQGHSSWIYSIAVSPDNQRIVSGSNDRTIRLWDATAGIIDDESLQSHSLSVRTIAFSPDGRRIVSGSDDKLLRLWDATTGDVIGEPLRGHSDLINSVKFSPDGKRIVSGSIDKTLRLWDVTTGAIIGEPLYGHSNHIHCVAFSPDGQRIASVARDRHVRLWNATTGAIISNPLIGHFGWVNSVVFSPDSHRILSGSNDRTLRLWNPTTGTIIGEPLRGHSDSVNCAAFSPDGQRIVSGSSDKTVCLWDATTGVIIGEPLHGHSSAVLSVEFSPDGRRIVSGSSDKTVRLWDATTGAVIGESLNGHSDWVLSVAFSPDGQRIVSGSFDSTLRLWNAANDPPTVFPDFKPVFAFLHRIQVTTPSNTLSTLYVKEDGWVVGPNQEPLFWLPPSLRTSIRSPGCIDIFGGKIMDLDLLYFKHGANWTECYHESRK